MDLEIALTRNSVAVNHVGCAPEGVTTDSHRKMIPCKKRLFFHINACISPENKLPQETGSIWTRFF